MESGTQAESIEVSSSLKVVRQGRFISIARFARLGSQRASQVRVRLWEDFEEERTLGKYASHTWGRDLKDKFGALQFAPKG